MRVEEADSCLAGRMAEVGVTGGLYECVTQKILGGTLGTPELRCAMWPLVTI